MATTTAKKKPATKKSTNKSASSTATTTVKKSSDLKVSKSSSSKRREITPFEKIRGLHFSNVFSGVILATLTVIFVNPQTRELILNYQARDTFINSDVVILGSATESLFSVDIRYILVAILGLSAIVSLVLATKLLKRYETTVKSGVSGFRWLLYGIVSVLVVELASLLAGVQELSTLKTVGALIIAGGLFAWLSDRENSVSKTPKKLAFFAAIFAYVLALLPMATSLIATSVVAGERFSWYVYVLGGVVILGTVATLMTLRSSIINKNKFEYAVFEQRYIRIDQIVKFVMVLTIFSAFNK